MYLTTPVVDNKLKVMAVDASNGRAEHGRKTTFWSQSRSLDTATSPAVP